MLEKFDARSMECLLAHSHLWPISGIQFWHQLKLARLVPKNTGVIRGKREDIERAGKIERGNTEKSQTLTSQSQAFPLFSVLRRYGYNKFTRHRNIFKWEIMGISEDFVSLSIVSKDWSYIHMTGIGFSCHLLGSANGEAVLPQLK